MNESTFISANKKQWQELEQLLDAKVRDPDKLQELFVKVSSDLSYARTFYPNRTVRLYLNNLTQRVLDLIQTRKNKFSWDIVVNYYRKILPEQLWRARYAFLVSLAVFAIAIAIGAISTAYNLDFARVILGDQYVELTNQNINEGDPMAIYKSQGQVEMFWGITLNNIRVAFVAFVMGLFGSIGTIILLMSNGIMLGSFQYFFYKKGLFLTSFLTIWIHGTLEISAIIIAGGAGIILGDGLLNPKTYSRSLSLQVASKRAIRVLLSTIPLFIIAGFLESYVTRLTDMSSLVKVSIIIISLAFILYHYVIYPYLYQLKNDLSQEDYNVQPADLEKVIESKIEYQSFSVISALSLAQFRVFIGTIFYRGILPVIIFVTAIYWIWAKYNALIQQEFIDYTNGVSLFHFTIGGWSLFVLYLLSLLHLITIIAMAYHKIGYTPKGYLQMLKSYGLQILLISVSYLAVFYFYSFWPFMLMILFLPPQIPISCLYLTIEDQLSFGSAIKQSFNTGYSTYTGYVGVFALLAFIYFLLVTIVDTLSNVLYTDFLTWHHIFPDYLSDTQYIYSIFGIIFSSFALTLYYFMYCNQYQSLECKEGSKDLFERIESFGLNEDTV